MTDTRKRLELQPRDWLSFEVIQRHGPLPSHYLHEFTKRLGRDMFAQRKRLLKLVQYGYLARPIQLNNPNVHDDFYVYALGDKAKEALRDMGRASLYATPVGGGYQHMFMSACVTASIELEAIKAGYRFIDQEEILADAPEATKDSERPLELPCAISHTFKGPRGPYTNTSNRPTVPDQLFGIDYGEVQSFFAVEIDRATEPAWRSNLNQNSYLRKVLCYRDINRTGIYKKQWGIPNLIILNVTVNAPHRDSIFDVIEDITKKPNGDFGMTNFLFHVVPNFAHYERVPPVLSHLWANAWARAGKSPFNISHT